jgi:uncharacterized protein (DUF488 family)
MTTLFTIGHSNHTPEFFTDLLQTHEIAAVYDVRSQPYSRFSPQFRRETLQTILREAGIEYVYIGDYLGGKPRPSPARFEAGLNRLRRDAPRRRIAIMCAEKDPLNCHRTWTIAESLPDMEIVHILPDGKVRAHADLMKDQPPKQVALF